jgi:quinol monooxygenase YgiN
MLANQPLGAEMELNRRTLLAASASLAAFSSSTRDAMAQAAPKSETSPQTVVLVAPVKAKPGEEDTVKEILTALVEPTRKEPGCLCYNLHQSKSDKTQFMFYEQWASKEALDAHGKMPYMKALGGKLKGHTEKSAGVTFYELLK